MKYSNLPYATVLTITEYCYEHQKDEPWFVIGFITNPAKYSKGLEEDLLDYLWERGFKDNLCLKI